MIRDKERKVAKEQQLLEAARLGRVEQLEQILSHFAQQKSRKKSNPLASLRRTFGPNNIRDPLTGFTCLHHAALNGHAKCVKLILADGAKLNAVDYKGSSALHLAAWSGNSEVVEILLNYNNQSTATGERTGSDEFACNPNAQQQSSSFSPSSSSSNSKSNGSQQQQKSHQQVDIDLCNNDNQTPLSLAAQFGHNKVVAMLLNKSANVHIRNSRLESPLDLACLNGKLDTVRLILDSSPTLRSDLRRPYATFAVSHDSNSTSVGDLSGGHNDQVAATSASRRASSGWASLLHRSGSNLGQQQQSPVAAYDHLRSHLKAPSNGSSIATRGMVLQASSPLRRATLATDSSAALLMSSPLRNLPFDLEAQQQREQEEDSATSSSLDDGGFEGHKFRIASLTNQQTDGRNQQAGRRHQFSRQQILLDHSPLHYAVRRAHLEVVNVLLNSYKANIMQLTSMGSVLHEIALSGAGKSTSSTTTRATTTTSKSSASNSIDDIINLLFAHIGMADGIQAQYSNLSQRPNPMALTSALAAATDTCPMTATSSKQLDYQFRLSLLDEFLGLKNSQQQTAMQLLDQINNRSAQETKRLINDYVDRIRQQANKYLQKQPRAPLNSASSDCNQQTVPMQSDSNQFNIDSNQTLAHSNPNQTQSSRLQQQEQPIVRQFSEQQHLNSFVTMKRVPKQSQNHPKLRLQSYSTTSDQTTANTNNPILHNITNRTLNDNVQKIGSYPSNTQTIGRCRTQYRTGQNAMQNYPMQLHNLTQNQPPPQLRQMHSFVRNEFPQDYTATYKQQLPIITRSVSNLSRTTASTSNSHDNPNYFVTPETSTAVAYGSTASEFGGCDPSVSRLIRKRRSKSRDSASLLLEAAHMRSIYNQECPLYDNEPQLGLGPSATTANHLVRSQTDCSHLMNRYVHSSEMTSNTCDFQAALRQQPQQPPQPYCSATLDRKMINRRYHVYEHEFYPPRLLNQLPNTTTGNNALPPQPAQSGGRVAVAVVPPFASSEQVSSAACGEDAMSTHRRQMQQMDRFLSRHSREVAPPVAVSAARTHHPLSSHGSNQVVPYQMSDESNVPTVESSQIGGATSSSGQLESHMSEPLLFETTQRALMRDFDLMLGRELLGKNSNNDIDNARSEQQVNRRQNQSDVNAVAVQFEVDKCNTLSTSASSTSSNRQLQQQQYQRPSSATTQSILTGVSLDMDHYGERLTVSGTRITLPINNSDSSSIGGSSNTGPLTQSSSSSLSVDVRDGEAYLRQPVDADVRSVSNLTQESSSGSILSAKSTSAPEKPPRPSLASSTKFQQMRRQQHRSLDSTGKSSSSSSSTAASTTKNVIYDQPAINMQDPKHRAASNLTHKSAAVAMAKPKIASDRPTHRPAVTQPPRERPPPPPPVPEQIRQQYFRPTQQASSNSTGTTTTHPLKRSSSTSGADADSGVCTSNSPASSSHNSDEPLKEPLEQMIEPVVPPISPPSPATAQTCIEDALRPIEQKTLVPADCQTVSPSQLSSPPLPIDNVDRWLMSDINLARLKGSAEADYENCTQLQRELEKSRSISLGNLLPTSTGREQKELSKTSGEEDYAKCSSISSSIRCATVSSDFSASNSIDHRSSNESCSSGCESMQTRRDAGEEVLLKVVVDKRPTNEPVADDDCSDSDEVFYINPIELKKISAKNQRRRTNGSAHCDAETLTDEELFATVDKDSGLIRFTLRKRRPTNSSEIALPVIDSKVTERSNSIQCSTAQKQDATATTESIIDTKRVHVDPSESESLQNNEKVDDGNKLPAPISEQVTTSTRRASDGPVPSSRIVRQLTSDDVEMPATEQVNSTSLSSSSSSKESIQSIVSLQKRAEIETATNSSQQSDVQSVTTEVAKKEVEEVGEKETARPQLEGSTQEAETQREDETKLETTAVPESTVVPKTSESMVCRAARELEAAMLRNQRQTGVGRAAAPDRKPVAAVRRFIGSGGQKQQSRDEIAGTNKGDELSKGSESKKIKEKEEESSQIIVQPGVRPTAIKSMCWPPKMTGNNASEPPEQSMGFNQNRLSFKKMIEEQSNGTNNPKPLGCVTNVISGVQSRPKPLPPAKPAKLVAAAYVNIIQQQQQQSK